MDILVNVCTNLIRPALEEDKVDALNFHVTSWILRAFAATVIIREWAGQPISCWTDTEITRSWEEYMEMYCFVETTYYVPINQTFSRFPVKELRLQYYQWVFVILALQSICFCLPHVFWHAFNWVGGVSVEALVEMAQSAASSSAADADKVFRQVAVTLREAEEHNKAVAAASAEAGVPRLFHVLSQARAFLFAKNRFVGPVYILTKALYVANAGLQLLFISFFVGDGDLFWGWTQIDHLVAGRGWRETGVFPRVTWCDVWQRKNVKNVVPHTLQCVLAVNMLNEKIFMFLWAWMALLLLVNVVSLVRWASQLLRLASRRSFFARLLATQDVPATGWEEYEAERFVAAASVDLTLVLRIVAANIGDLSAARVLGHLWRLHLKHREEGAPLRFYSDDVGDYESLGALGQPPSPPSPSSPLLRPSASPLRPKSRQPFVDDGHFR